MREKEERFLKNSEEEKWDIVIPLLICSGMFKSFFSKIIKNRKSSKSKKSLNDDQRTKDRQNKILHETIEELEDDSFGLSKKDRALNQQAEKAFQQKLIERRLERGKKKTKDEIDFREKMLSPRLEVEIATKITEQKDCYLCKLPIFENEQYYRCFVCNTVYHKEHLQDWLVNEDKCPLCNQQFIIYIEEIDEEK